MEKNIVEQVRMFVEEECKKPSNIYCYGIYLDHFVPMCQYGKKLAEELGADIEVVELAVWLHDIGSVMNEKENHHIIGAEIAEKKLKEFDYPLEKIEKVKKCILNHRGSVNNKRESLEEQIVADADAMNHFDKVPDLFIVAYNSEKKNIFETKKYIKQKLIRSWNKLSLENSKKLIKPKYEAAMLLLE